MLAFWLILTELWGVKALRPVGVYQHTGGRANGSQVQPRPP